MARTIRHALTAVVAVSLLLGAAPALADDDQETLLEKARATAADLAPSVPVSPATPAAPDGAAGPLFVAVDDATVTQQRVDVVTNGFSPAFTGEEAWGSAYDPGNDRILFNDGSTLLEWPVGGTTGTLGTFTDPTGATLAMTGLAFANDTLYACRNIANEAIFEVDLTTLVATVLIDYDDADFDCGGLAADPATGSIYMTSDDATPASGLYLMNPDGTGTLITGYPAGETDIDGLAIGDGRAYLVIDEPGSIFVWDFGLGAYQTPLTNPWATSEIFSAGAWIGQPMPEITLAKTVGLDPGVCGTETFLQVPAGTTVQYCFTVTNTGNVTLNIHDLVDSQLGAVLSGFLFDLLPGESTDVIVPHIPADTVTNTATWTAGIVGGPSAEAEAEATVEVLQPPVVEIPTLSTIGLGALVLALLGLGLVALRRRAMT